MYFPDKLIHIPTQVQRLGALDPVGVQVDEKGEWLHLSNPDDGPKILEVVQKLVVSDEDIGLTEDGLFGLRPTDRDRGMHLFRGGNVVADSIKFVTGTLRGPDKREVWIVSGDVVASQRGRVYRGEGCL